MIYRNRRIKIILLYNSNTGENLMYFISILKAAKFFGISAHKIRKHCRREKILDKETLSFLCIKYITINEAKRLQESSTNQ